MEMRVFKIAAILVLGLGLFACQTCRQPPPMAPDQREAIRESPFTEVRVGVGWSDEVDPARQWVYWLGEFLEIVNKSGVFKEARIYKDSSDPPDLVLVLQSSPPPMMCATPQACATICTLGIIPMVNMGDKVYDFRITSPKADGFVPVQYVYTAKGYTGLISLVLNTSSGWSGTPDRQGNLDWFRFEILKHKDEIRRLLESAPDRKQNS